MRIIIQGNKSSIYNFDISSKKTVLSLYSDFNLDKFNIYFLCNGKILKDQESLDSYDGQIIESRIRLKGGKGGFGSSLRLQQATKKQTKNFDACRDLQGRRIRKVNQERQLSEWRTKKAEEEKLLKKYIEGYNNNEVDLFKKIMNEKRNMDAIKKNQKFYEDNEFLKLDIKKSIKMYLNKKRGRNLINKEQKEKEKNEKNGMGKKWRKFKKIKKKKIDENKEINDNNGIDNEKEIIERIKKMNNEEDLFDAILA
jgi:hypothetical protein